MAITASMIMTLIATATALLSVGGTHLGAEIGQAPPYGEAPPPPYGQPPPYGEAPPYGQPPPYGAEKEMNVIDKCWRNDVDWARQRKKLATCAVGFGSNAQGGADGEIYTVTTSEDDPEDPKPGSLRYGATRTRPLWIIFDRDMGFTLSMPLYVSSNKTIDGRGANVSITFGSCIRIQNSSNVIIHGLNIRLCHAGTGGKVYFSEEKGVIHTGNSDGDAIAVFGSTNVWIDHTELCCCDDGLLDVTMLSNFVTISNNRMLNHSKTMLLGSSDDFPDDKDMKVTVAFNHFGPDLVQRIPRARFGYVHVVNNDYEPWKLYAIGGSSGPTILSQNNRFMAATLRPRVTNRQGLDEKCGSGSIWNCYETNSENPGTHWNWQSVGDIFINGAFFVGTGAGTPVLPSYAPHQNFTAAPAQSVPAITRDAGALSCPLTRPCL